MAGGKKAAPQKAASRLRMRIAALEITLESGRAPVVEGVVTIEEDGKVSTVEIGRRPRKQESR